jgi:peptidylprolyl isomerase
MKKSILSMAVMALLMAGTMSACTENSPYPGYKMTPSGMYYRYLTQNEGETAKLGDVIAIDLDYYLMNEKGDSLLYSTSMIPEQAYDLVREPSFPGDLYEGFTMMHKGDSMSFIMNADSVFRRQFHAPVVPEFVTPDAMIRWEVKMKDIMTEEEFMARQAAKEEAAFAEAQQVLDAFIAENGIEATPTESGLIYVCTKPGKGSQPQAGQTVKVHYTGKLLDGTVFDSSVERDEPISIPIGVGRVIPGWDEGISMMKKGEKGILYIPAKLGYGAHGSGPIPPFSNLIFEVELIDFE